MPRGVARLQTAHAGRTVPSRARMSCAIRRSGAADAVVEAHVGDTEEATVPAKAKMASESEVALRTGATRRAMLRKAVARRAQYGVAMAFRNSVGGWARLLRAIRLRFA